MKIHSTQLNLSTLCGLLLLILFVAGCGSTTDSSGQSDQEDSSLNLADPADAPLPTIIPTIPLADADESPRQDPSGIILPPTFTPEPRGENLTGAGPGVPQSTDSDGGTTQAEAAVTPSGETYTVQEGDTLGEIATEFGVTVDQLLAINQELIENIDEIEVGWVLQIPESGS